MAADTGALSKMILVTPCRGREEVPDLIRREGSEPGSTMYLDEVPSLHMSVTEYRKEQGQS